MTVSSFERPSPLTVAVQDGNATVRVAGDVDLLGVDDLAAALAVLADQRVHRIDLDLRDARRVDASSVELLAATHARLCSRGGRLRVVGATDAVEELLRRRGLRGLLRS